MTPEQLRESAKRIRLHNKGIADWWEAVEIIDAHAAALEEIERLNAAWKAQQFHLEAEERESAHWQERAENAERRAERLKVHAEAMAESLESEIEARYAGLTDYPSMRRKYQQDMEEVEAYRAAYPKE